ncbi:hypothetical protein [Photobacterium sanguinicancri]|uniref:Uncharacterized protein n=1 Tax=Photobacterium sanguinicancri TaxID=875932 RepID=A0ABX4G2X6_9GAMM|nr:hypothetical protein [Photobacterium sanguinicancri]OZS45195.1 hypothetical protein ASV53_04060 [Photobacterium sanguinicancri]
MQNSKFQCLSKRNKAKRDNCLKRVDVNEVDMYVLDEKGFIALWISSMKMQGLSDVQIEAKATALGVAGFIASNGSAMHDIKNFYLLANDLKKGGSILSKYEVTKNGSKSYIKFKGNHKLRNIIKGTRYLSSNAKVITLGIGKAGMRASAKAGVIVTVIYSVAFRTLELALTKNYSVANWVSNVSSDLTMAAIATVIGLIVGTSVIASGIVVAPIFTLGVVTFISGWLLDYLNGRYLIKNKIVNALNNYLDQQAKLRVDNAIHRGLTNKATQSLHINTHGLMF